MSQKKQKRDNFIQISILSVLYGFVVFVGLMLSGCSISYDQSLHELAAGNIEEGQHLATKELAELEAAAPGLTGKKAYENAMARWDKMGGIAAIYLGEGQFQKAISLSERYIKIFSNDYQIVNRYYNTLRKKGYGDPNAAYPTAEETLIGKLCSAYGTLISSYSRLNDYDKANLYAKEALHVHSQLRLQIRRYGASSLYPTLFRAFFDSRDTENTEKMVRLMESYMGDLISRPSIERNQSLDMANMNRMPLFQSLAFYHFHQKDYKQAETYYRQYLLAMEKLVNQTNAMAKDLEKTGIKFKPVSFIPIDDFLIDCLIKQNQIDTAWQMAQEAETWTAANYPEQKDSPQFWNGQKQMGDLYLFKGQTSQAIERYRLAADLIEQMRSRLHDSRAKILYAMGMQELYDSLITCLAEQGRFAEAFEYSERSRARAFLDLMEGRRPSVQDPNLQYLLAERETVMGSMAQTDQKIKKESGEAKASLVRAITLDKKKLQRIEHDISLQYPELASTITATTVSLDAVKAGLESDMQLVEYYVTDKKTFVWVIGKETFQGKILNVGRKEIEEWVHTCRAAISSIDRRAGSEAASELYKQLIRPIKSQLNKAGRLCLVPHASLHYLPFQVLTNKDRYMVNDYTVTYAPSASVFSLCRNKRTDKALTLFAIGNPDLHDPALALPYAQKEVEALHSEFPDAMVICGSSATKEMFLNHASQYHLIHLATHGTYDALNPMQSGLVLAGADQKERVLTADQIFKCRLNAYSVTLSACETAMGKAVAGDELISITRAFLYAGTPSVLSTLWSVHDQATAYLMMAYYNNLKKMDKATALRHAQIATMKKYPHPFYWGAFVLTGDWM